MEINGVKYVKEEKISSLLSEIESLKSENKKLIEVIKKILPFEENDIHYLFSHHGLTYMRNKIRRDGFYGNERLEYETIIDDLNAEISSLKSKITKLEKQYKHNNDGTINLKKVNENKLKQIQQLVNEIME